MQVNPLFSIESASTSSCFSITHCMSIHLLGILSPNLCRTVFTTLMMPLLRCLAFPAWSLPMSLSRECIMTWYCLSHTQWAYVTQGPSAHLLMSWVMEPMDTRVVSMVAYLWRMADTPVLDIDDDFVVFVVVPAIEWGLSVAFLKMLALLCTPTAIARRVASSLVETLDLLLWLRRLRVLTFLTSGAPGERLSAWVSREDGIAVEAGGLMRGPWKGWSYSGVPAVPGVAVVILVDAERSAGLLPDIWDYHRR